MRQVASLLAGAVIGALGGLVLGEYPFTGWTPYVAGVLFALVVTEVMLTISRTHGPLLGIGGGVFSAGGLGWAVWISSGRGIEPIPGGGWIAIALGFVVAMVRGFLPYRRPAPAPPPDDRAEAASPLDLLDEFIAPPGSAIIVGSPPVRLREAQRENPRPESPGGLPAPGEFGTPTAGDPPAGAREHTPAAEEPSGSTATAPKATTKAGTKPARRAGPKATSNTAPKGAPRPAAKAGSTAGSRAPAASTSAKKAPAKSGAQPSGGRAQSTGGRAKSTAGGASTAGAKSTSAGKARQKASKKAAAPAPGSSSRTSKPPAKAAVKKAKSPTTRSRKGGR